MVVCTGQVLTCAHVICDDAGSAAPDSTVSVEFVSVRGTPGVPARVAANGWVPIRDDGSGDIALLDLDGESRGVGPAPLRRGRLDRGLSVHTFGFPAGAEEYGINATAVLSGPGGPEWIQLDSPQDDRRVTSGFSGAAVVDQEGHAVIGMVVTEYVRDRPTVSWMLPVERILSYLPDLRTCVAGDAAVDEGLITSDRGSRPGNDFVRQVGRWFFAREGRPVRLVVTGEPDSSASSGLRSMIVLADRELRPPTVGSSADGTVPPVGSIDLAVDASGKTVDALSARITDRFGPSTDAGRGLPAALVVDAVDDAADPQALLRELLKPLADDGMRLLLGFHRESSPAWELALSLWSGADKPDDHPDVVRQRLGELAARVDDITSRENELLQYRHYVAERVSGVPEVPRQAVALRFRLAALRLGGGDTAGLEDAEEAAVRAVQRLDRLRRRLDDQIDRRNELRRRLEAYHAMAVDLGLAENVDLDPYYRRAHDALRRRPSDLAVASRLVAEYREAIRSFEEGG
jgi:hypothetical protein